MGTFPKEPSFFLKKRDSPYSLEVRTERDNPNNSYIVKGDVPQGTTLSRLY